MVFLRGVCGLFLMGLFTAFGLFLYPVEAKLYRYCREHEGRLDRYVARSELALFFLFFSHLVCSRALVLLGRLLFSVLSYPRRHVVHT